MSRMDITRESSITHRTFKRWWWIIDWGDRMVSDELDVLRGGHGTVLFFEEEQGELSPSYTS